MYWVIGCLCVQGIFRKHVIAGGRVIIIKREYGFLPKYVIKWENVYYILYQGYLYLGM